MGLPHVCVPFLSSAGALSPTHCQVFPSGPFTVPDRVLPTSLPSNTMSLLLPSSSFGETKVRVPFEISTLGRGRHFPHRPTIRAFNWPSSCWISSHQGYC